ncbi:suppressor of fused domain protein [Hymenobacter aquaticus]|uniref:Suppressor of fused domain protein n=1 Tax=Hymenobacter aquaticus TaxID=1867101 RepID=A0A4Z0Q980_9BACT|nr:suppressor of fused domain protein [Hymenobacter aquaticus]TGE25976.1 suppressor of fused domain protein [Hymenobacter aquaticus]
MEYTAKCRKHFESFFGPKSAMRHLEAGPREKLHPAFFVLEFPPEQVYDFWIYCTVGMSLDRGDDNLIELFVYSPHQDDSLVELMTVCAYYHRNVLPLNLHHTVNIGQPWLDDSQCDHAFISLPYFDSEDLELLQHNDVTTHCYWLIPITESERDFKVEKGYEALEGLFEDAKFDYLNPARTSLV